MMYILTGADTFSRAQELKAIKENLGTPDMLSVNTTTLIGDGIEPDYLQELCQTAPFLNPVRLILVEGLLSSFEADRKARGKSKNGDTQAKTRLQQWQQFADFVNSMPQSTVLVLIEDKISSDNPLMKLFGKTAGVKQFPSLKDQSLIKWIQSRVASSGGSIDINALRLIIDYCGNDLWVLNGEIEKLLTYNSDQKIREEDVRALTCYSRETNIFNLVDAIFEKKIDEAQKVLHRLFNEGASSSYVLGMITRQLRLIVRAKCLAPKTNKSQALDILSLSSEYALSKTLNQAKRYSYDELKKVYHMVLQTDVDIKTGKYDENLAVEVLVTELGKP